MLGTRPENPTSESACERWGLLRSLSLNYQKSERPGKKKSGCGKSRRQIPSYVTKLIRIDEAFHFGIIDVVFVNDSKSGADQCWNRLTG